MPRLEGQKSNSAMMIALLVVGLVVAFMALEYFGVVNVIPGFGPAGGATNA